MSDYLEVNVGDYFFKIPGGESLMDEWYAVKPRTRKEQEFKQRFKDLAQKVLDDAGWVPQFTLLDGCALESDAGAAESVGEGYAEADDYALDDGVDGSYYLGKKTVLGWHAQYEDGDLEDCIRHEMLTRALKDWPPSPREIGGFVYRFGPRDAEGNLLPDWPRAQVQSDRGGLFWDDRIGPRDAEGNIEDNRTPEQRMEDEVHLICERARYPSDGPIPF